MPVRLEHTTLDETSFLPCIKSHRVLAYDFMENAVPGIHPYEEWGYWRDVGTMEAYWQANMDVFGEKHQFLIYAM